MLIIMIWYYLENQAVMFSVMHFACVCKFKVVSVVYTQGNTMKDSYMG